jgi:hypothetical protein
MCRRRRRIVNTQAVLRYLFQPQCTVAVLCSTCCQFSVRPIKRWAVPNIELPSGGNVMII